MPPILKELQQRKVFRVAAAYVVGAWLVLQVGDVLIGMLDLPAWSGKLLIALLVLGLPVALGLAWAYELTPEGVRPDPGRDSATASPDSDADAPPTRSDETRKSIAVLPLVNMSEDPNNEYFADGLTEELFDAFTRIKDLRVASRTSCFVYRDSDLDVPSIARKLRVEHVLEGSVRKVGNRVRITAQLIEAASDSHLWSETYDRELDDIFAIQRDIARQISRALHVSLSAPDADTATTDDAQAYDLYLRGRYALQLHDPHSALREFEKAVERDPDFVRAWVELAQCHGYVAIFHRGGDAARRAAEQASARALSLAPTRGDVHAARGVAMLAAGRHDDAIEAFEEAIRLNPNSFIAYYNYGRACLQLGEPEKAADLLSRAAQADSSNFEALFISVGVYKELGKTDRMMAAAREGLARAERHLEAYPNNQRAYYMGALGWILLGDLVKARTWADRAREIDPAGPTTLYNLACLYVQLGEPERAMDQLEALPPHGQSSRSWTLNDPDLAPLRGNARFERYLETLTD